MKNNQNGFGIVIITLLVAILIATGLIAMHVRSKNQSSSSFSGTTQEPSGDSGTIEITLIDDETGKPLPNISAKLHSDNGTRCERAPCPMNSLEWNGTSDSHGVLSVPKKYIQYTSSITITGYNELKPLRYDKNQSSYTVTFNTTDSKKPL